MKDITVIPVVGMSVGCMGVFYCKVTHVDANKRTFKLFAGRDRNWHDLAKVGDKVILNTEM